MALAADSTDDTGVTLEQVIVTALKRESPAQSTAVSVSTFDAARIEAGGIASLVDVSQFTPNANFSQSSEEMGSPLAAAGSIFRKRGPASTSTLPCIP
jgi:outer membrane receptor protein involved in Fe transport